LTYIFKISIFHVCLFMSSLIFFYIFVYISAVFISQFVKYFLFDIVKACYRFFINFYLYVFKHVLRMFPCFLIILIVLDKMRDLLKNNINIKNYVWSILTINFETVKKSDGQFFERSFLLSEKLTRVCPIGMTNFILWLTLIKIVNDYL